MQNDDILSIAEQVARQSNEQRNRQVIESFIRGLQVASERDIHFNIVRLMGEYGDHDPEISRWAYMRGRPFAIEFSQALAILLRRELLPDEAKGE